jgi:hypothetical protein
MYSRQLFGPGRCARGARQCELVPDEPLLSKIYRTLDWVHGIMFRLGFGFVQRSAYACDVDARDR